MTNNLIKRWLSKFNKFCIHEWTKLGEDDNLYNALMYAINETDWVPDGPHGNFRLMGQGDDAVYFHYDIKSWALREYLRKWGFLKPNERL